ncbi:hypothetical protein CR513_32236, partial [Mucuna pruriens]
MVNEIGVVDNLRLENQLTELTSLVRQLVIGQHQPNIAAKVCGICTSGDHPTDLCSTLQEIESNQRDNVGAIGGYQYAKQPQPFRPGSNQGPYVAQQFGLMEDETSRKGSTLILGRPFLMTARTKIDVHVGTFSMEFGDTLVQFNIFEAMKHPTEDHSLFGIDLIDELKTDLNGCLGSISKEEANYAKSREVHNLSDSVDNNNDIADLDFEVELLEILDQVCKYENLECSIEAEVQVAETKEPFIAQEQVEAKSISDNQGENCIPSGSDFKENQRAESDFHLTRTKSTKSSRPQQLKAEIMSTHLDPKAFNANSSSPPPPMELKPLSKQDDKLLQVLREYKKAIGWKLSDLPGINPSIFMHRILMEEEAKPIRQQLRRMNLTILDMVKKEVTKLLVARIIYPISDSQLVSPV